MKLSGDSAKPDKVLFKIVLIIKGEDEFLAEEDKGKNKVTRSAWAPQNLIGLYLCGLCVLGLAFPDYVGPF